MKHPSFPDVIDATEVFSKQAVITAIPETTHILYQDKFGVQWVVRQMILLHTSPQILAWVMLYPALLRLTRVAFSEMQALKPHPADRHGIHVYKYTDMHLLFSGPGSQEMQQVQKVLWVALRPFHHQPLPLPHFSAFSAPSTLCWLFTCTSPLHGATSTSVLFHPWKSQTSPMILALKTVMCQEKS